jgi:pimeloyl-[acyl-carrier protein] methyl ester esterase
VLLHGWAMHSGLWGPLVARLATRFRVHAVDLPGHGHSAAIDPYTLESVTAAVIAGFDRESEPLIIIGWSLGGIIALRWARIDPDRVARLALIATSPRFVTSDDWPHAMAPETLARFGDELRVSYRLTMLRFLSLQLQGTDHGRAALSSLRRHFFERGKPAEKVLIQALAVLAAVDLRSELPAIRQRAVAIAGDRDKLVPLAAARWLSIVLPNAQLAPIVGAAHVPFLSHPDVFATALDGFLDER